MLLDSMAMKMEKLRSTDVNVFEAHRVHTSGPRIHTDSAICHAIIDQYPDHCLTVTKCNLVKFAEAGYASMTPVLNGPPLLLIREYDSQGRDRTLSDEDPSGVMTSKILFGCYDYKWQEHDFRIFVVNGQSHLGPAANDWRIYIINRPAENEVAGRSISGTADAVVKAAQVWAEKSDQEVWMFDQGKWQKNHALWLALRDAKFEDILGDAAHKTDIERDTVGFFEAREQYALYGVPWKRGLIFHGPPGNGKTLMLKAIMRALSDRSIPALYVKSIASNVVTPQGLLRLIFLHARENAPCLLIFEDIDSIVTEDVRSYFFNEVDGLEVNDGILMVGSTNNLEKLDIGLSQRPGRFDRKYVFNLPNQEERVQFCSRWNQKLSHMPIGALDDNELNTFASSTAGFSYAYLQESYMSALLTLARRTNDKTVSGATAFATLLQAQVETLRLEMAARSP